MQEGPARKGRGCRPVQTRARTPEKGRHQLMQRTCKMSTMLLFSQRKEFCCSYALIVSMMSLARLYMLSPLRITVQSIIWAILMLPSLLLYLKIAIYASPYMKTYMHNEDAKMPWKLTDGQIYRTQDCEWCVLRHCLGICSLPPVPLIWNNQILRFASLFKYMTAVNLNAYSCTRKLHYLL